MSTNLLQWFQGLIGSGKAIGWQSFGQSSPQNSKELGQDVGLPLGTPVPGTAGTVTSVVAWDAATGDMAVTIKDALGNLFTVGHIIPNVKVGQQVSANDVIGWSNGPKSAISTGPHIELQVQPAGDASTVDPVQWIDNAGQKVLNTAQGGAQAAAQAVGNIQVPGQSQLQAAASALSSVGQQFSNISTTLSNLQSFVGNTANWWRIFFYIVGVLLIVLGVVIYVVH